MIKLSQKKSIFAEVVQLAPYTTGNWVRGKERLAGVTQLVE